MLLVVSALSASDSSRCVRALLGRGCLPKHRRRRSFQTRGKTSVQQTLHELPSRWVLDRGREGGRGEGEREGTFKEIKEGHMGECEERKRRRMKKRKRQKEEEEINKS